MLTKGEILFIGFLVEGTPYFQATGIKIKISKQYLHSLLIAALFIIARMWKQLKCPLAVEWINKNKVYICNGILFNLKEERPPIKRDDLDELGGYEAKWSFSHRETNTA